MKIGNLFVNGKIQSLKCVNFPQINYNEFKVILKNNPSKAFHRSWQADSQKHRVENRSDNFEEADRGHINLQWLKQERQETCMPKKKLHI